MKSYPSRIALGLSYNGQAYQGWQSQCNGLTIQDHLQQALKKFTHTKINTICAGRTDTGVHALMQVVHFDTSVVRQPSAWVRGCNTFLPADIAIQWACEVPHHFHARASAKSRRYAYIVLESKVRPSLEIHQVGWVFQQLNLQAMQKASDYLLGQHDFSSFRASSCQALNPIKTIYSLQIRKLGAYWRFDFEANAFLHRMIRNLVASLIFVGKGKRPPHWIQTVLNAKDRSMAAPTFAPDGLYFLGPRYSSTWQLPETTSAFDYLPGSTFSENTIKPNTHFQLTP